MKAKRNLLMLMMTVVVSLVAASPAAAINVFWAGPVGGDMAVAANWTQDPALDGFKTSEYRIDAGISVTKNIGYLGYGHARIKAGGLLTQNDGTMEWINGSGGVVKGLALFNGGSTLHMTGGTHITDQLGVGIDLFGNTKVGSDTVNIWGTGTFRIRENPFVAGWIGLDMNAGGIIDIRDSGSLRVETGFGLESIVDAFILSGNITSGTGVLGTSTVGGEYVVSVVPEPASLALLGLGLGSLALVRRRV